MRASTDKNIQGYNLFAELFPILSQPELTLQPQVLKLSSKRKVICQCLEEKDWPYTDPLEKLVYVLH